MADLITDSSIYSMFHIVLILIIVLWGVLLISIEAGYRFGNWYRAIDPAGSNVGSSTIEAALFGLLGLLIAFTFSGAASRLDERRQLIVEETNAIGTAYMRLDNLYPDAQPPLRDKFRKYIDSRLKIYQHVSDPVALRTAIRLSAQLQNEIWLDAVAAVAHEGSSPAAPVLLLPALNEMFDITTTRYASAMMHPPAVIYIMLISLEIAAALLAGYGMSGRKSREWIYRLAFSTFIALTTYAIIEIEYPRLGFVGVDEFDQFLYNMTSSLGG